MNSCLRPNYRRARQLALEIETQTNLLDEIRGDPSYTAEQIDELRTEINHLKREFFLTGVTSEYNL